MLARAWPAWMSGTAAARLKSPPVRLDAIGMSGWLGAPTLRYDAIVVVLPLVALASYLKVGAPSQPDTPIASRRTGEDFTLAAAVPDIHAGQARADIAALPPEQRSNAIRGMVGGLAEKLSKNGHDLQGWLQLIRSYVVLGERQKAEAAAASARAQLAGDAQAPARIDEIVRQLGLKG